MIYLEAMMVENQIRADLNSLGFTNNYELFHKGTRDREDINILKHESGILITDRTNHITEKTYKDKQGYSYWQSTDRNTVIAKQYKDTLRRTEYINRYSGKTWLDIGTGAGAILEVSNRHAECVEPQEEPRKELSKHYKCYQSLSESNTYDLITMFHVLEHIPNQIQFIRECYDHLNNKGIMIIEVPHAKCQLIELCTAYRDFTFWSEHLILHTMQSLIWLCSSCGFVPYGENYIQRYSFANHLYWLSYGKPGGEKALSDYTNIELDRVYAEQLQKTEKTDTIIAVFYKP